MMQWVLSIVVGVSLSRFINTLALIGRKKDQVKFDFLLISILFATTTQMIHLWFNSPGYFSNIEGIYIPYMLLFLITLIYATAIESLLPNSSVLETVGTVDLRDVYYQQKDLFYLAQFLIGVIMLSLYIFYPQVEGMAFGLESKMVEIPILFILTIVFPIILIISNNYFLHVFNMMLISLGFLGQILKYATTMT
ncbi:hypothetical protein MK131_07420 [Candidatus Poribacteria bacterium]|nr:hypothetical protein [Candidatus Poribacteria bacterium]